MLFVRIRSTPVSIHYCKVIEERDFQLQALRVMEGVETKIMYFILSIGCPCWDSDSSSPDSSIQNIARHLSVRNTHHLGVNAQVLREAEFDSNIYLVASL